MKWVSHRDHMDSIMKLHKRIDDLEFQVSLNRQAQEDAAFRAAEETEIDARHAVQFRADGNIIIGNFTRKRN